VSGHSHWSSIKHKKGAADAKRGRLFSKLARLIQTAARSGGSDPDTNLQLRYAIEEAKAASMPKDNIERAIKKGTGELAGEALEPLRYEGYGPGGVALMVEALSDNRNRTAAEVRKIFELHGASMATTNAVAWQFEQKGLFVIQTDHVDEDDLMELVLEAGADNMETVSDTYEVTCPVTAFEAVRSALEKRGVPTALGEISQIPNATVEVDRETGRKLFRLLEALDDHDDVQKVYANFQMDDTVMAELSEAV
jgi:YebC/PmpR family DNA-binding regulatory protein